MFSAKIILPREEVDVAHENYDIVGLNQILQNENYQGQTLIESLQHLL